ncbi:MAG TPA: hypothetical protein EYH06_07390 [Chromatiales bacterium]|nr:hypothetical protein [Thiotrichales bacterium]HIP68399.1 hypothetical protein [Chromatiales bacterium]
MGELSNNYKWALRNTSGIEPNTPLWQRVPKTDDQGRLLSDFMMLIPGLRHRGRQQIKSTVEKLSAVLARYQHVVVFADLNLRLNLLWVSIRTQPGLCLELPAAIKEAVPEALLIANNPQ